MKLVLKNTSDGSPTFFLPDLNEQYHSLNGAVTESKYVFTEKGLNFHQSRNPVSLEVGFGTGLNCLLTAHEAELQKREVYYMTIEKYPLGYEEIKALDYGRFVPENGRKLFFAIHTCEWNIPFEISPWFSLLKIKTDITQLNWQLPRRCDIIYFDAFGPDKQPEMWTGNLFSRVFEVTQPGGVFVTYSAKGEVRRRLSAAGFSMEKLPGPPGKKEMLRGIKVLSKI
jgi:tRNA U34 5-methylaminomethyl-2-thiouridine-forming methyltransferase MnmC